VTETLFAIVAVNSAAYGGGTAYPYREAGEASLYPGPVFHYHVPPELRRDVPPGALVEVPFGTRLVQGLVVALSERAPVDETKPVKRVRFAAPVLSAEQIELGLWLSFRYCTPLIECYRLMLPPGMLRQPRSILRLRPAEPIPTDLPEPQRAVVQLLERHGTVTRGQIARGIGREDARAAVNALVGRGLVIRGSVLPAPAVRPKRVNYVRLVASPPQIEDTRSFLGHASKQADILQALLEEADPLPSRKRVLAEADAADSTLRAVADKGWVELTSERRLVVLSPQAHQTDLSSTPAQHATVACLEAMGRPLEAHELCEAAHVSMSSLRTLVERGLAEIVIEPAAVILSIAEGQARAEIAALRGAKLQHCILDYLLSRPAGEWIWVSWVYAETGAGLTDLRALEEHGLVELAEREVWRDPLADRSFALERPPRLTPDQERAWAAIRPSLEAPPATDATPPAGAVPPVYLLHGVTGSGKTEIYLCAAEAALQHGRQAIVLVPEISLTPQAIRRFSARFPQGLGVIHSRLSAGERYDTWRRIRTGQIRLVVGPRSALFAPLSNIGLIVLDEEHDASYKQDDVMPTYHARDVALRIAGQHGSTVILGSATPDVGTYYRATETKEVQLIELPGRVLYHQRQIDEQQVLLARTQARYRPLGPGYPDVYAAELPPVRIIDMRHELRAGNHHMFSRTLQAEMQRALQDGEQVILYLNRRGAATFVMCRDCGYIIRCPHCDVPLAFHLKGQQLTCHHCNHHEPVPYVCPLCDSRRIKHFGVGTQRVEHALHELLPSARLLRWDSDTTREKGSHEALLDRFIDHEADVLIGTQMIAKGLDLPLVTLVGIVSADTALNLPDLRSAERTFQLLEQVAGRAGRGLRGGQVIVQTYTPEHYAIRAAAGHDYSSFYARECAFRRRAGYPPYAHLARLLYYSPDLSRCREQAAELAASLQSRIEADSLSTVSLIGPAPAFLRRLHGRWRWQVLLRATRADELHALLCQTELPPGWRLDVDPLDVL
jgi:primosomal protein N' (replication factor Y)